MSQAGLARVLKARDLDLSRASITNIENGRHRIQVHVLYSIAGALGVNVRDLLPQTISSDAEYPFHQSVSDSARAAIERVVASKKKGDRDAGS